MGKLTNILFFLNLTKKIILTPKELTELFVCFLIPYIFMKKKYRETMSSGKESLDMSSYNINNKK